MAPFAVVNTSRFRPDSEWKRRIRQLQGIPDDGVVFLYVWATQGPTRESWIWRKHSQRLGGNRGEAWLLNRWPG